MSSHGLTETEMASMGPVCVCTRSSVLMLWLLGWCFCGTLKRGSDCIAALLPALETLFILLGVLSSLNMRAYTLSYRILFCPLWLLCHGDLLVSEEGKERVNLGKK